MCVPNSKNKDLDSAQTLQRETFKYEIEIQSRFIDIENLIQIMQRDS